MNTGESLEIRKRGKTCIVTLNCHKGMNLLGTKTLSELGDSLRVIGEDDQIRALIITGTGNFSAGADIREMIAMGPEEADVFSGLGQAICTMIETMGKAVIAAVSGYALGGGCEVALACDIRIADESARFGQLEMNLGIIPGFGGTQRLARLMGGGKAKELILTGRVIDAVEAESIGLVNKVVKEGELMREAEEIAGIIAQKSPIAVRKAKRLMNGCPEARGFEEERASFADCFAFQDYREGMNAFLEKRRPVFRGI